MDQTQCPSGKVLHLSTQSADAHIASLVKLGYDQASLYKCRLCPFLHVTANQHRTAKSIPKTKRPHLGRRGRTHRRPHQDSIDDFE